MENTNEVEFYTSLEDAKKEIWQRWNDKELRKKVEEYLSGNLPGPFGDKPIAVLARNLATPDIEFLHFLKMSNSLGLFPVVLEYLDDKFFTMNSEKMGFVRLRFFIKNKSNYIQIVNLKESDNKKFSEIMTIYNKKLIDFHHDLIDASKLNFNLNDNVFDMSSWYHGMGEKVGDYYHFFLALFICHGVLFEDYVDNGYEEKFTRDIFIPAFEKVESYFGLRPIISPIIPVEELDNEEWWSYPPEMREVILNK